MISNRTEPEDRSEVRLNHPKFHSPVVLLRELANTLKLGWRMRRNLKKMDPRLREIISLTVTFANNCAV